MRRERGTVPRAAPAAHCFAGQALMISLDAHACGTLVNIQMEWQLAIVLQMENFRYANSTNLRKK